jgi:predicted CopG family antitoxin
MDYLDYLDEVYEELVEEFGHEIESDCIHKWYKSHSRLRRVAWKCRRYLL